MKSKSKTGAFITLGVAICLLLGYLLYINSKKIKFDWTETYKQSSEEPYGTSLLTKLLVPYFGKGNFTVGNKALSKALSNSEQSGIKNYLFIGDRLFLGDADTDTLLAFVEKGNNAFIAAPYIPHELDNALGFDSCGTSESMTGIQTDSIIQLNFFHPDLCSSTPYEYRYAYKGVCTRYEWNYFITNDTCRYLPAIQCLGYLQPEKPDFIRIAYGKGFFYFHFNPLVFTNYSLLEAPHLEYTGKVFSHLPPGKTYWDELSRVPGPTRRELQDPGKGPLHYLLSQEPIRWAWYTMLGLILTYFLFRAMRRQRVIPVILPNENTSLEFVQTVGELYYQQSDHQKLCMQKMKLFLLFIRNRYYLTTNQLNEALIKAIATKSQVAIEDVSKIFTLYAAYQNTVVAVDQGELIAFHKALEHFYRTCK